ncbi:hypothetical protein [Limosilactobacillus reuteri]|uniref:Uncharacterized protein n=2 Tax=Limosilactobacillus reuteri TaxID=1598 RepID=A0A7X2KHU6_LIMRT|nr:hypothetical protein [Limosilactobacillus reuteri]MRG90103.1 hypothetical protein [Limosilactobacillus reuteri]
MTMMIKVVPHEEAVKIQQQNEKLEQLLLLTSMPSLASDVIRNQLFADPLLQMTNDSYTLDKQRKKKLEAEKLRKKREQQQAIKRNKQENEYGPDL